MKKLLFGVALFFGAIMFTSGNLQAQEEEEEGNSYGGVCCLNLVRTCPHPAFGDVAESEWKAGISFCP